MNTKEFFKGFIFFWKGMQAAKREMWVSVQVLLVLTLILSVILYVVEHAAQPEVYTNLWDSIVWSFMSYLGNPGNFSPGDPVTIVGRFIWILISVINILIFAVPAGLVANGFNNAMQEDKRDKQLQNYCDSMLLSFRSLVNVPLKDYLNQHQEKDVFHGKSPYWVPDYVPAAKIQLRNNMELKDILDTANKYPEYRVANLAAMHDTEENPKDRFVVTHQPINRSYGYFIDRKSKITIVSTSSVNETLTGWFAFYLAKLGGFNYISKDIEVDINDLDSFLVMTDNVKVYGLTEDELERDKKNNKEKLEILAQKEKNRKDFLNDLEILCKGKESWLIVVNTCIKNLDNHDDFHFCMSKKDGQLPMVNDESLPTYNLLTENFAKMASEEFNYSAVQSYRYPLSHGFVGYKLLKKNPELKFNAFRLNIGANVILDSRKNITLIRMVQVIKGSIEGNDTLSPEAIEEMKHRHFGFSEYNEEEAEKRCSLKKEKH